MARYSNPNTVYYNPEVVDEYFSRSRTSDNLSYIDDSKLESEICPEDDVFEYNIGNEHD